MRLGHSLTPYSGQLYVDLWRRVDPNPAQECLVATGARQRNSPAVRRGWDNLVATAPVPLAECVSRLDNGKPPGEAEDCHRRLLKEQKEDFRSRTLRDQEDQRLRATEAHHRKAHERDEDLRFERILWEKKRDLDQQHRPPKGKPQQSPAPDLTRATERDPMSDVDRNSLRGSSRLDPLCRPHSYPPRSEWTDDAVDVTKRTSRTLPRQRQRKPLKPRLKQFLRPRAQRRQPGMHLNAPLQHNDGEPEDQEESKGQHSTGNWQRRPKGYMRFAEDTPRGLPLLFNRGWIRRITGGMAAMAHGIAVQDDSG
mmetsp:Transcript_7922/g.11197  ORF Transcript_7922/g.11197 Transcript_7922/m.11197 type:complete len:310 (+) Transcript_7922:623-1552(+)